MGLLAKVYRGNELLHMDAFSTALVQEGDVFLEFTHSKYHSSEWQWTR